MAKSRNSAGRTGVPGVESRVDLPKFERVAQFRAESYNPDDNTIEIVWTTGASVRRYDYWDGTEYDEVLSLEPGAVRLDRLNLGAPFLDTHTSYSCKSVLGAVVPGSAVIKDGEGTCRILLSRAAGDADTVQKIKDGVIRNNSVGYWIHKVVKTDGRDGKIARWEIVDWEPLEISAVPIPADPGAQVRSESAPQDGTGPATRSCAFVITRLPARGPKPPAKQETPMARTPAKKTPAQRLAELETENKRLADLLASKRDADDKKDDDERASEDEDDKRDGDEADSENAADEDDKKDGDDEGDDARSDDDDADDKKDDERAAPVPAGKRAMTQAEVRKAAELAVRQDRIRGSEIRTIAAQFGFPNLGERHAAGETSVRAFKDLVLKRLAERQKTRGNTTFNAGGTPEAEERHSLRNQSVPSQSRDFDKGAAEARALLGLNAA